MEKFPALRTHRVMNNTLLGGAAIHRRLKRIIEDSQAPKLLDVNQSYVNNAHSLVKDSETLDLSTQLKGLRKDLDKCSRSHSVTEDRVHRMKAEIFQIEQMRQTNTFQYENKINWVEALTQRREHVLSQQQLEVKNQKMYEHLLDRMKLTMIHLTSKKNDLKQQLHNVNSQLFSEAKRENKTFESRHRAYQALMKLKSAAKQEVDIRRKDVERIDVDLSNVDKARTRKEDLRKQQQEKIEQDMIKQSSQKSELLKESLLPHRLFFFLINHKFEGQRLSARTIENAFQNIKQKTGLSDIKEVIERFLIKEQTLGELMETVKQRELDLEVLNLKIEGIQEDVATIAVGSSSAENRPLFNMCQNELLLQEKLNTGIIAKHARIHNTYEKIQLWLSRIHSKMHTQLGKPVPTTPESLKEIILSIRSEVKNTLQGSPQSLIESVGRIKSETLSEIINQILTTRRTARSTLNALDEEEEELVGIDSEGSIK